MAILSTLFYVILATFILSSTLVIVKQWENAVILRFGKFNRIMKPGLQVRIPIIEQVIKEDLRERSFDLHPQKILTKDTVPVEVNAVVFYKIHDIKKSVIDAQDWKEMTNERAKTDLREAVSKANLSDVLTNRDKIAAMIKKSLDTATDPWGVTVTAVKIKDVILPTTMERAMAKEAEAYREKEARIIKASAELEASKQFAAASKTLAISPGALQLRQLQTWQEIGQEQNSLMILIPSDLKGTSEIMGAAAMGKIELNKKLRRKNKDAR